MLCLNFVPYLFIHIQMILQIFKYFQLISTSSQETWILVFDVLWTKQKHPLELVMSLNSSGSQGNKGVGIDRVCSSIKILWFTTIKKKVSFVREKLCWFYWKKKKNQTLVFHSSLWPVYQKHFVKVWLGKTNK